MVPGIGDTTFDIAKVDDPHHLENVDFAVLRGHFCVAENGAIWVTDDNVKHRVLYFIPQHISLVVPASQIVHNMHEAYSRITIGAHLFAGFISGPSKTADIEQVSRDRRPRGSFTDFVPGGCAVKFEKRKNRGRIFCTTGPSRD